MGCHTGGNANCVVFFLYCQLRVFWDMSHNRLMSYVALPSVSHDVLTFTLRYLPPTTGDKSIKLAIDSM